MVFWLFLGSWILGLYSNESLILSIYVIGTLLLTTLLYLKEEKLIKVLGMALGVFLCAHFYGSFRLPIHPPEIKAPITVEGKVTKVYENHNGGYRSVVTITSPNKLKG